MNETRKYSSQATFQKIIKWPQAGIVLALLVLYVLLAISTSTFFRSGNIVNVVRQTAISIIIGIPITFTLAAGLLDLSIGSLACLGSILISSFITGHSSPTIEICPSFPIPVAILLGLAITTLFGMMNGLIITRLNLPPFIVTLAMQEIAKGVVLTYTRGYPVANLPVSVTNFGRGTFLAVPYTVYIMFVLLAVFWVILSKTKFGRHVYAVGGNSECARLSGVNVNKTKLIIYTLNAAFATVAGIFVSFRLGSSQADLGATYGLDAITACCLGGTAMGGGKGYMFGTILGCLFLTSLSTGFNLMNVNPYMQQIIKGCVLIISIALNARDQFQTGRKKVQAA